MTFPPRHRLSLSVLVALAVCGRALAPVAHAQDRVEPYRYSLGFDLDIPVEWMTQHDVRGAELLVLSPVSEQGDGFRENLNVSVEGVPFGRGLEEVYRRGFAVMREGLAEFEVIETGEVSVGVYPARRLLYEHVYDGQRLRVLAYLVLTPGRCFTLTGTAPARRFETVQPTFEQMVRSFRPD